MVITRQYPPVDNHLYSHRLSALKCIDVLKRSYIGITSGSERVENMADVYNEITLFLCFKNHILKEVARKFEFFWIHIHYFSKVIIKISTTKKI